eukprot:SAG22_NODE_11054_length_503_cov_0.655941_1_plen_53_part_10
MLLLLPHPSMGNPTNMLVSHGDCILILCCMLNVVVKIVVKKEVFCGTYLFIFY